MDVFNDVVQKFGTVFRRDSNYNLIQRLRQTVLKIGLRRINTSYSRISFADVAAKLKLDSAEDAEYVCAKNIRDGVIKAELDHETSAMISRDQVLLLCASKYQYRTSVIDIVCVVVLHEQADLYSTSEPQQSFHDRISFCLEMHDNAVKVGFNVQLFA